MLSTVLTVSAMAQLVDTITVRVGKQAPAKHSGLKIRFLEISEDSRCPSGVNCIWAGNARVKFEVTNRGGGNRSLEANTTTGPKGDQFDGWAIELVSLTPRPTKKGKPAKNLYIATFSVTRLQR